MRGVNTFEAPGSVASRSFRKARLTAARGHPVKRLVPTSSRPSREPIQDPRPRYCIAAPRFSTACLDQPFLVVLQPLRGVLTAITPSQDRRGDVVQILVGDRKSVVW